ncbi:MAG: VanZ family protein [Deltaproteobacteria bacterium]|nr:VanZ family protein [Deltaproteobacteria bacterium]
MKHALELLLGHPRRLLGGFFAYLAGAFTLTHLPGDVVDVGSKDELVHTFGYLGLGLVLSAALTAFGVARGRRLCVVVIGLLLYGVFDEVSQPWFGRTAEFGDLGSDVIGITAAAAAWEALLRRRVE